MTVLKDAAAAALYGARGANGVILVTTKKGKSGDTQISLDARWGVNSRLVKNYDVLQNANTYMETAYSALYNGYLYNSGYTAERAYQLANADLFPKLGYQVYTIPDGQYLIGRNGKLNLMQLWDIVTVTIIIHRITGLMRCSKVICAKSIILVFLVVRTN